MQLSGLFDELAPLHTVEETYLCQLNRKLVKPQNRYRRNGEQQKYSIFYPFWDSKFRFSSPQPSHLPHQQIHYSLLETFLKQRVSELHREIQTTKRHNCDVDIQKQLKNCYSTTLETEISTRAHFEVLISSASLRNYLQIYNNNISVRLLCAI
jgi:hypothetical protein